MINQKFLFAQQEELIFQFEGLRAEVEFLKKENTEIKYQMATQDQEIQFLKNKLSKLDESAIPLKVWASYETNKTVENKFSNKNEGLAPRRDTLPETCKDLYRFSSVKGMDGIYLVKDNAANKRLYSVSLIVTPTIVRIVKLSHFYYYLKIIFFKEMFT